MAATGSSSLWLVDFLFVFVCSIVFNATFNNISEVRFMGGGTGESHYQTLLQNFARLDRDLNSQHQWL